MASSFIQDQLSARTSLLSLTELAHLLGKHRQTIWRWTKAGKLPAVRVGAMLMFDPAAILNLLESRQL